ncbi:MAG TPA: alpha/beta fold hydrolase [Ktedonobacterales bacterium]
MSGTGSAAKSETPAALLVHGFNGEPLDMEELEEHLQARGFATRNLLLPGHGTHVRHFAQTTWADWAEAVTAAAHDLLKRHTRLVLVGHSMGGALSLHLAATDARVAGVAALCPPLHMLPGQFEFTAWMRHLFPFLPTLREDIYDPEAQHRYRRRAYRWTPLPAAHSLFSALPQLQAELSHVHCPSLIVCARQDHVVPVGDGIEIFRRLGTNDRELLVLERSYHVVMKDVERALVFERVGAFAARATRHAVHAHQRGA